MRCTHTMRPGVALLPTFRRVPYIAGIVSAFYPSGARIGRCMKCIHCGYSVTDEQRKAALDRMADNAERLGLDY